MLKQICALDAMVATVWPYLIVKVFKIVSNGPLGSSKVPVGDGAADNGRPMAKSASRAYSS